MLSVGSGGDVVRLGLLGIDIEPGAGVVGAEFGFGGSEIAVTGEYASVYELAAADIVYVDDTCERW